jgi:hypothetical protein
VAVGIAVPTVIFGLWMALGAFLMLVVFTEGPMTPRSYSAEEKARNRVHGTLGAAGALASFGVAAGAIWWGFRRPRDTRDRPPLP